MSQELPKSRGLRADPVGDLRLQARVPQEDISEGQLRTAVQWVQPPCEEYKGGLFPVRVPIPAISVIPIPPMT